MTTAHKERRFPTHAITGAVAVLALAGAGAWFLTRGPVSIVALRDTLRPSSTRICTCTLGTSGDAPEANLFTGAVPGARTDDEATGTYIAKMGAHNIVFAVGLGSPGTVRRRRARDPERIVGGIGFPRRTLPVYRRERSDPVHCDVRVRLRRDDPQKSSHGRLAQ